MVKNLLLIGLLAATVSTETLAQDREPRMVMGIRSALIAGSMDLSGLDPAFDDLAFDGLEGAHMSGFFLMFTVRPHLRVGVETLVSNSDKTARTTMNYQAAGPVVEVSYGSTWYVSGGLHAGGLIVNAMSRTGPAPTTGATSGSYFKGDGGFVSPYVDVGYRRGRREVGLFVKRVSVFGEPERGGISDFSSTFVGLRVGVRR